jgi:hypothetical protein
LKKLRWFLLIALFWLVTYDKDEVYTFVQANFNVVMIGILWFVAMTYLDKEKLLTYNLQHPHGHTSVAIKPKIIGDWYVFRCDGVRRLPLDGKHCYVIPKHMVTINGHNYYTDCVIRKKSIELLPFEVQDYIDDGTYDMDNLYHGDRRFVDLLKDPSLAVDSVVNDVKESALHTIKQISQAKYNFVRAVNMNSEETNKMFGDKAILDSLSDFQKKLKNE